LVTPVDTARSAASISRLLRASIPLRYSRGWKETSVKCPHWGFVLRGELTTTDAAGKQETVSADDLFYWPPGHNVRVDADAEIVMFSPQHEHSHVINHMIEKTKG
jgi:mannose-6-phosphate isomerase-like protein (cupin superfamily)